MLLFLVGSCSVQAQECDDVLVRIVARNDHGEFIPDISFEIDEQITDVDGNPKPGEKVASGKTSAITGYGEVSFDPSWGLFSIKMWDQNSNVGAFYFYDDLQLVCGDVVNIEKRLSGIRVALRDASGELRKNTKFYIYTQNYDVDGNLIKEKKDLVATLNTGEYGAVTIYVSNHSHSLDGTGGDYYVLSVPGAEGGTFEKYNIYVSDNSATEINYKFSRMKLILKDAQGNSFPAKTKISIYEQKYDNGNQLGDFVKSIYTDDHGEATLEYPYGTYAARVKGEDGQYYTFWNLRIYDQLEKEYTLNTGSDWSPGDETCSGESLFDLAIEDLDGNRLPEMNFELYEQNNDINEAPSIGKLIKKGKTLDNGRGSISFKPDPRKVYALKIYDKNKEVGAFWYYNEIKFSCGQNKEVVKRLPALHVILRDADGNLKRHQKFSIYAQKIDADGNPIKEKGDLINSSLNTSEEGEATIYLSPYNIYNSSGGNYVFVTTGENKGEFVEYNVKILDNQNTELEYVFSDIILKLNNALDQSLVGRKVTFYKQDKEAGNYVLKDKITSLTTDENGEIRLEYPGGKYALVFEDDLGQDLVYWNVNIYSQKRTKKTLKTNLTRLSATGADGKLKPEKTSITIYNMKEDENGLFYKDKKIKSVRLGPNGYVDLVLAQKPYLFVFKEDKKEYARAFYAVRGQFQKLNIAAVSGNELVAGKKYKLEKPVDSNKLAQKLSGYILLQVEEHGEAWYVDPNTKNRYYLKNGSTAYELMRKFGLGITNADLEKIPIGISSKFEEEDYDSDGLPNKMEEALGTDMYDADSDDDGYIDGVEVRNGYNPLGTGRLPWDKNFANKLKGKILLQVESKGEAWYINPVDGKRYYMKDGNSAYQIMRYLSLGITNEDLDKIEEGEEL